MTTVASLALPATDIEAEITQLKGNTDSNTSLSSHRQHAGDLKRAEALQRLLEEGSPLATADLAKRVSASVSILRPLERRGIIHITKAQTVRNPMSSESIAPTQPFPFKSGAIGSVDRNSGNTIIARCQACR